MEEIFTLIAQFVGSIGFPIAAYILMFLQNRETTRQVSELAQTISVSNKELSASISENTKVLTELKERIK